MGRSQRLSLGLLALIPLSLLARALCWGDAAIFLSSIAAIVTLAIWMARATEELGQALGPSLGGLLTALFGNAAEVILALSALRAGLVTIVKASITGSLIANLLLTLGLAMLAGGIGRGEQRFQPVLARVGGAAMSLAVMAMLIPTMASLGVEPGDALEDPLIRQAFSRFVAWVLLAIYGLMLLFSLRTHSSLFQLLEPQLEYATIPLPLSPAAETPAQESHAPGGNAVRLWLAVLLGATLLLAVESELFMAVVEPVSSGLGLSATFTGIVLLPLLGGVPESITAISLARRDRIDLAVAVAFGSTQLVALLMVPLLVLVGPWLGHPIDLSLGIYELMAVVSALVISNLVSLDGRCDWLEGVLLIGAYGILAAGFWYEAGSPALS